MPDKKSRLTSKDSAMWTPQIAIHNICTAR